MPGPPIPPRLAQTPLVPALCGERSGWPVHKGTGSRQLAWASRIRCRERLAGAQLQQVRTGSS
jgi:hypothetical protein